MTIDEAVKFFGGQKRMARLLGVRQNAISMWKKRGNTIPIGVQWQIELGTRGALYADEAPILWDKVDPA